LRGRRAQRVGGLQRMAALHAEPARTAVPHFGVELANDRTHRSEVFLKLYRHAAPAHGAATTGALGRQRRPEPLVHLSRGLAMRGAPIRGTRLPAGTCGRRAGGAFRERRRVAEARALRRRQQDLQAVDLLPQPVLLAAVPGPLPLQSCPLLLPLRPFAFKPRAVLFQSFDLVDQFRPRGGLPRTGHASVMPDSRSLYKGRMEIVPAMKTGSATR